MDHRPVADLGVQRFDKIIGENKNMTDGSKKIGIVCCSNGQKISCREKIKDLEKTLLSLGLIPVFSGYIYEKEDVFSGTAKERAHALMDFYRDDEIKEIFDISGGDIANGILPYLDYGVIADSEKLFWGYSDLTTVINAIYAKTKKASVLYQIRNLIYQHKEQQIADFTNTVIHQKEDLFRIKHHFIRKKEMHGIVVGGNIRCFLKLAGTEYMPDLQDKILLLESLSGTVAKMETFLCQLEQNGAFDKVSGILLGTFTEMQEKNCMPSIESLILKFAGKDMPVAVTMDVGHGTDAKAAMIGQMMEFHSNGIT